MHEISLKEFMELESNPVLKSHALLLSEVSSVHIIEEHHIFRFCCNKLNHLIDSYDIEKNLNGFNEDPVIAWVFVRLPDGSKAHAYPPSYVVGHSITDGYGYSIDSLGLEQMLKDGIPSDVPNRILNYLLNHKEHHVTDI